jgi:hypothetical protein
MSCPTEPLIDAAQHILRYLERHDELGLTYSSSSTQISGSADSNWIKDQSTIGWIFQHSTAAISWGSKKQKTLALSHSDAAIMSASEAAKEGVYLKELIKEIESPIESPMPISVSDTGIVSSKYEPNHKNTKHIERRHLWLQELVDNGQTEFAYVNNIDNMADFFTQHLNPKAFVHMRDRIMNVASRVSSGHEGRGGVATQ